MLPSSFIGSHGLTWLSLLFTIVITACSPLDEFTRSTKISAGPSLLRVGVSPDTPPLIYKKAGKIIGLEADFARLFGKYSGKKVTFVEIKENKQIEALENNEIDIIMSAMSITTTSQHRVAFSTPYLRAGQIMLVRLRDKSLFSTGIYSLSNSDYIIGTVQNTTGDLFISQAIQEAKRATFVTSAEAGQALIEKRIDVFVYDAPTICHYAAINTNKQLVPILTLATEEYLAWGIRKEDDELLTMANEFLQELEIRQELPRMIRNWIPFM